MITKSDDADQWKANNIGIGELLYSTGSIGGRLIWEELLYSLILRPTTEFNHFSKFTALWSVKQVYNDITIDILYIKIHHSIQVLKTWDFNS